MFNRFWSVCVEKMLILKTYTLLYLSSPFSLFNTFNIFSSSNKSVNKFVYRKRVKDFPNSTSMVTVCKFEFKYQRNWRFQLMNIRIGLDLNKSNATQLFVAQSKTERVVSGDFDRATERHFHFIFKCNFTRFSIHDAETQPQYIILLCFSLFAQSHFDLCVCGFFFILIPFNQLCHLISLQLRRKVDLYLFYVAPAYQQLKTGNGNELPGRHIHAKLKLPRV